MGRVSVLRSWAACVAALAAAAAYGQESNPALKWESAIAAFDAADADSPPAPGGVVFVGSSSIRLWDLPRYFPQAAAINRGFGGSQLSDAVHYLDRLVLRHRPRVVVTYAGDNDINAGKDPAQVVRDFEEFCRRVHRSLRYTRIVYIAIKPSLKRWNLVDSMRQANAEIRALCERDLRLEFVDIDRPMLGDDGRPRPELFVEDGLHLSPRGYEIWSEIVRPLLQPEHREAALRHFTAATWRGEGGELPYRIMAPAEVEPGRKYPLVLFLHGAGERGSDNRMQLVHGMPEFASDTIRRRFPCYVVAPQCPAGAQWVDAPWDQEDHVAPQHASNSLQAVFGLVEQLREELPVDAGRIYLTGLSMGGFGAWDAAVRKPDWFAAVAPICGGGDVSLADRLTGVPIWAAHGDQDSAVPVALSRRMVAAIRAAGGSPKYTEYAGVGHHSWVNFYNDVATYEWMFQQAK